MVNGKIYIGVHLCNKLDDNYLGSGIILKCAIKKYGKSSFIRRTIAVYNSHQEAFKHESEIVTEDFIKRPDVYNATCGGRGGIRSEAAREKSRLSHLGLKHTPEYKKFMSESYKGKGNPFYGKKHTNTKRFGHQKNNRSIIIDEIKYESCKAAAKAFDISPSLISRWIKQGKAIKL